MMRPGRPGLNRSCSPDLVWVAWYACAMSVDPLSFFQPGLEFWNREKERQRHETHEYFVGAPPWDSQLDDGLIRLELSDVNDPSRPTGDEG